MCVMCKAAKLQGIEQFTFSLAVKVFENGKPDYSMLSFYHYVGMTDREIRRLRQSNYKRIKVSHAAAKKITFLASIYQHPHEQTLKKAYEARERS